MYQIYQVQYLQSHKPSFWGYKMIKESTSYGRPIYRESIKYSFLKSFGKLKMCFTCVTYTDSESVTRLIQKKISKQVTEMVHEL